MKCPLCEKECESLDSTKGILPPSFHCPTQVVIPPFGYDGEFGGPRSHFIRFSAGGWSTGSYYEENAFLMPYRLDNHLNSNVTYRGDKAGNRTEIIHKPTSHIFHFGIDNRQRHPAMDKHPRNLRFNHVLRLPLIHMDIEERLRQRLKLLLLLS